MDVNDLNCVLMELMFETGVYFILAFAMYKMFEI